MMEVLRGESAEVIVRQILMAAVQEGASDVHIEPLSSYVRVRFRKDGVLTPRFSIASSEAAGLSVRIKVLGRMDVSESRLPQDGSYSCHIHKVPFDFRLSVVPSLYGETIVVRILSGEVGFIERNELGMSDSQKALFLKYLKRSSGMILTTGPTGSGKTSTLYAALRLIDREALNVISIEDPVEYRMEGVTQLEVHEKAGLTFAKGLRSMVRQDPDVVMVGEIRDKETAEIAIHAALTGHLVLSTLHTESASKAPLRLIDMGIAPYLVASSLSLVISQRLAPVLCPHCKKKAELSEEDVQYYRFPEKFIGKTVYKPSSCGKCHGRGFSSRQGIFELMSMGRRERFLVKEGAPADQLIEAMNQRGMLPLGKMALLQMEKGVISPEEAALLWAGQE